MKRIAVIGSPGAGKTTFAKKLSSILSLPLYHLDFFYHDNKFAYYEDKQAWRAKVEELADKPNWIIDGNYMSTFDIRFDKADTIIFLDFSRTVALRRAIARRITLHNKARDDMPSNWKEKLSPGLIKFIWSYNKVERPKVHKLLNGFMAEKNILILESPERARLFLDDISSNSVNSRK